MKVGPFMPLKYVPVIPEGARAGQRTGGRPSWLDRGLQSSSVAVPDSPGSFQTTGQSVRYTRGYRVSRHRAVKRASSGDSLRLSRDLDEQLSDLPEAAAEFGIPEPPTSLVEEVRRILWNLRSGTSVRCLVYLMPDGAVAVDVRGMRPDGIFISIRGDGSAHCSGETEGKVWRKTYPSSQELPDDTLLDELWRLRSGVSKE